MATFWEIAAHCVDHKFFFYFDYLFQFLFLMAGFRVLIASVPDLCILFTSIAHPITSKLDYDLHTMPITPMQYRPLENHLYKYFNCALK